MKVIAFAVSCFFCVLIQFLGIWYMCTTILEQSKTWNSVFYSVKFNLNLHIHFHVAGFIILMTTCRSTIFTYTVFQFLGFFLNIHNEYICKFYFFLVFNYFFGIDLNDWEYLDQIIKHFSWLMICIAKWPSKIYWFALSQATHTIYVCIYVL